jgi:hypothetical protein
MRSINIFANKKLVFAVFLFHLYLLGLNKLVLLIVLNVELQTSFKRERAADPFFIRTM